MTVKTSLTKLSNLFKFLISLLITFIIKLKKNEILPNTLLIIRLDVIGDYILFRNFLKTVHNSEKYRNHRITLCGNILWKEIAETFDKEVVDSFIWIDRRKFSKNILYKHKILVEIYTEGFETAVDTTYSREILFGDSIIRASNAKLRIGSIGALDKHAKWKRNLLTDKYYTKLVNTTNKNSFEFYRNKEFFEKLLSENISLSKPSFNFISPKAVIQSPNEYVILFLGASDRIKIWNIENFTEVGLFILQNYDFDIVLPVSSKEKTIADILESRINSKRVTNLSGKLSLVELIKIVSKAKIVISNETGVVHISAATGVPFICVSNGVFFGRFHPYPKEIFKDGYYVYPPQIMKDINNPEKLSELYRFQSNLDINLIKPDDVIKQISKVLGEY
jgi:ADP-heptose:LPS heptosyltransferase